MLNKTLKVIKGLCILLMTLALHSWSAGKDSHDKKSFFNGAWHHYGPDGSDVFRLYKDAERIQDPFLQFFYIADFSLKIPVTHESDYGRYDEITIKLIDQYGDPLVMKEGVMPQVKEIEMSFTCGIWIVTQSSYKLGGHAYDEHFLLKIEYGKSEECVTYKVQKHIESLLGLKSSRKLESINVAQIQYDKKTNFKLHEYSFTEKKFMTRSCSKPNEGQRELLSFIKDEFGKTRKANKYKTGGVPR